MGNKLEQLKVKTDIVADTSDIDAIRRCQPQGATTSLCLLLKTNASATAKLATGVRNFVADQVELERLIRTR